MLSNYSKEILQVLIQAAKNRETLTYGQVAERLGRPGETLAIPNALGRVSEYTYQELGVFISVLVVNEKTGSPGMGLIQMASKAIGLDCTCLPNSFLRRHLKTVFAINHKELDSLLV